MDEWYYIENDETVGPVNISSLFQHLQKVAAPSEVLVWKFGQPDWLRVAQIPDLMRVISRPPPRPVPRPPAIMAEPIIEKPKATAAPLWEKVVGWVAAIVSMLLARYLGAVFWVPLLLVLGSYAFFKWLKLEPWTVGMLAVLCGQTLWAVVGHAIILSTRSSDPGLPSASIDFVVVIALTFWSVKKQSVWPASLILCYQFLATAGNLLTGEGVITSTGLAIHLSLRALGIAFAIYAIWKSRRRAEAVSLPL